VPHHLQLLRSIGYDGTITLEVFSEDKQYLAYSRDLLRKIWDEVGPLAAPMKTNASSPQTACCD